MKAERLRGKTMDFLSFPPVGLRDFNYSSVFGHIDFLGKGATTPLEDVSAQVSKFTRFAHKHGGDKPRLSMRLVSNGTFRA